jgi:hypothetical protein
MRYRHVVREVDGSKVLVKITTIAKGTRSQGWIGPIDLHDYSIRADFRAAESGVGKPGDPATPVAGDAAKPAGSDAEAFAKAFGNPAALEKARMPDMGLIAQRYTLDLMGASQQLQLRTWPPQVATHFSKTVPFAWPRSGLRDAAGSELTLNGRFDGEFNALKEARIDLNGTGSNDADTLSVTGPAALNGTLRVVIGTNYVITPGDQFVIVNSTGARTGTFSSLVVEPAQLGIDASVQYLSNSVVLTIDGCVICGYCNYDYNRDENVDLLDAQQMAQVFVGLIQPEANWLDGDLNLDENADLTDAQLLARAIVQGLCEL